MKKIYAEYVSYKQVDYENDTYEKALKENLPNICDNCSGYEIIDYDFEKPYLEPYGFEEDNKTYVGYVFSVKLKEDVKDEEVDNVLDELSKNQKEYFEFCDECKKTNEFKFWRYVIY